MYQIDCDCGNITAKVLQNCCQKIEKLVLTESFSSNPNGLNNLGCFYLSKLKSLRDLNVCILLIIKMIIWLTMLVWQKCLEIDHFSMQTFVWVLLFRIKSNKFEESIKKF